MADFNEGPWKAETDTDGEFNIWGQIQGRSVVICSRRPWPHNNEGSVANARLIAAAPELLIGCIEAEKVFRWYGDLHGAKPDAEKAKRNYDMADELAAIIAKAKGEA